MQCPKAIETLKWTVTSILLQKYHRKSRFLLAVIISRGALCRVIIEELRYDYTAEGNLTYILGRQPPNPPMADMLQPVSSSTFETFKAQMAHFWVF